MTHRTRPVLVFVLAVLPVAGALGQPTLGTSEESLVAQLLPYLGSEQFQKELRLTPDQVAALLAHRQQLWDEKFSALPSEYRAGSFDRVLATRKVFRTTLKPEQQDRARQLGAQVALRPPSRKAIDTTRIETRHLAAYAELRAELSLDSDQTAIVAADRYASTVYLTTPQTAALEKILGPRADVNWTSESDPRAIRKVTPFAAYWSPLFLMSSTDVRAELKLTVDQVRALDALRAATPGGLGSPPLSPEKQAQTRDELEQRAEQILTPAQRTRLHQIAAQRSGTLSSPDHFARQDVQRELALGAAQERALDAARSAFTDAVARVALSGDKVDVVERVVRDATATRDRAFLAVLTGEQKAKFAVVFGEPFAGTFDPDPRARVSARTRRETGFGRYRDELSILTLNKAVQDELKITPERLTLLREANQRKPRLPIESTADDADGLSEYVGKMLSDLLTPGQARRFRQIMLQGRERLAAERFSALEIPSAVAYPGVAEAVKLTDVQRTSLIDGAAPIDVLTPEQQVAVRGMLGEPFRGEFGTAVSSRSRAPAPRVEAAMNVPWDAIGLTPAQVTTVAQAINKYQVAAKASAATAPNPFRTRPVTDPGALSEKAITAALTPEQVRRLDQLVVQTAAGRDLRSTLTGPDVGPRVALTPDQHARAIAIEQEWRKLFRVVLSARLPAESREVLFPRLRDQLDGRILAVLSPEQRMVWDEIVGEPIPAIRRSLPVFPPVH